MTVLFHFAYASYNLGKINILIDIAWKIILSSPSNELFQPELNYWAVLFDKVGYTCR